MLTQQRLEQILRKFPQNRIAVIGDFFLDKYQEIDPALEEKSLETGLAAHQIVRKWDSPGAAGTVVNNLRGLGAGKLYAIGITGDDGEGYELRRGLKERLCDTSALLAFGDLFTPVYLKTMAKGKVGLAAERDRFDTKNRSPLPPDIERSLVSEIDRIWPEVDGIILADQVEEENCGVLTATIRQHLSARAQSEPTKIVWVDSRRRIGLYTGISAKPNVAECVRGVGGQVPPEAPARGFDDETVLRYGKALQRKLGKPVCVTRGKRGVCVFEQDRVTPVPGVRVPEPTDPTGAGDSTMAGIVMGLAAGASVVEAAFIGTLVASITVQALGTTGFATPDQLPPRLELWREQQSLSP
jgi:rfaE bifunctional protein kinase chain/domain